LRAAERIIYVVYYNPVAAECFDAAPLLSRWFARMLPYAADELGYGPDEEDPVIIWQGGAAIPPAQPANAKVVRSKSGLRVVLEDA
jgi:hypothetical protein